MVQDGRECWAVEWAKVRRVSVHKEDLFGGDLIVVVLWAGEEVGQRVDEEMEGFDAFCEEMRLRCLGMAPGWYENVMLPPFARNEMTIWNAP